MKRFTFSTFTCLIALSVVLGTPSAAHADDYSGIANAVASPLVSRIQDLEKAYSNGQVMLRVELARQRLQSVTAVGADLAEPHRNILVHLDSCHSSMEELRRLSRKVPDFGMIARKIIEASPALVREDPATGGLMPEDRRAVDEMAATLINEGINAIADAWKASNERENYRNHYRLARKEALALANVAQRRCAGKTPIGYGVGIAVEITDDSIVVTEAMPEGSAAKAGIRKGDEIIAVAGKAVKRRNAADTAIDQTVFLSLGGPRDSKIRVTYSRGGVEKTVDLSRSFPFHIDIFDIDLDGSWNATFPHDSLSLRNVSDAELTNCTLLVTLIGTHGDGEALVQQRHLHYVDKWPANQSRYARYLSSTADDIAAGESVDRVQQLVIELYSDQFRDTIKYQYAGTPAFDEDIERYVGLIGKQQKFTLTFIGDNFFTDAGITLQHDGTFAFIPDPELTVKLSRGNDIRTVVWRASGERWSSGNFSAYALKDPSLNGMNPDRVDVDLKFPGSPKKISRFWTFADR